MKKLYFAIFLLLITSRWIATFAQTTPPAISYPSPQTYNAGVTIAPLAPLNSGGAVPVGFYAQASNFTGSGLYGFVDGAPATARFGNAVSITKDPSGNYYVADANNNCIRKIDPSGVVSTFAGSGVKGKDDGAANVATFSYPTGVAADAAGNIYVADYGNHIIRKITPAGVVSTLAGNGFSGTANGTGSNAQFNLPYGLVVDPTTGDIIVADTYNNVIRSITPAGVVSTLAGSYRIGSTNGTAANASFWGPHGVAIDKAGNIFVVDRFNGQIRKITPTGTVSLFSSGQYYLPVGIAVDNVNNLYVTNQEGFITRANPAGVTSIFAGQPGAPDALVNGIDTASRFSGYMGILFDESGSLLLADPKNFRIRRIELTGYHADSDLPPGLSMSNTGTISGTATQLSPAANYAISAYNTAGVSSANVNIQVVQSGQTITFPPIPAKKYGDVNFASNAVSSNKTIPLTYSSSDPSVAFIAADSIHIVGAGTTQITVNQAGNPSFSAATPVTQTLMVSTTPLTITARDNFKRQGDDNPVLTATYTGFVRGEDSTTLNLQPAITTTAVKASPGGSYPITFSGASSRNYTITYVAGTLSVLPAPTITAGGPLTFANGGQVTLTANPNGNSYTYQWLKDSVAIPGATGSSYIAKASGNYAVDVYVNNYHRTSPAVKVTATLILPANNFKILLTGGSCKGGNDGSITITPVIVTDYTAFITGGGFSSSYSFRDVLKINSLKPGPYSLCITVDGQTYQQCFSVNITEPKDLSLFSTINKDLNTINLQMSGSAGGYTVKLNDVEYKTSKSDITLPLKIGENRIVVFTDKLCQGIIEKIVTMNDKITPYPNPFQNILNVNIGNDAVKNAAYDVISVTSGKVVYSGKSSNQAGVMRVDLSGIPGGIYYFKLNLDNKESAFKIIKQ